MVMKKILVLCTGNSCRSQMAEGYLRYFVKGKFEIYSAGIEAHGINTRAIIVMKEDGIDISANTSDSITVYEGINFDCVITVCANARDHCPPFPTSVQKFHRNFYDPANAVGNDNEVMDKFREIRDQIKAYCKDFIHQYS